MDKTLFNKTFFPRNDDMAFKIAVMFSRYNPIPMSSQEYYFFGGEQFVYKGINFLTFSEMFNETLTYVNNWIDELDRIGDEQEWKFHRSKILTRFLTQKRINYDTLYESVKQHDVSQANIIRNTSIVWSNSIYYSEEDQYIKNYNDTVWELWQILKKYRDEDFDYIKGEASHSKILKQSIKYRNEDKFYKNHNATLIDFKSIFDGMEDIDNIEKNIAAIFLKNNLEENVPIFSAIKKRLKI